MGSTSSGPPGAAPRETRDDAVAALDVGAVVPIKEPADEPDSVLMGSSFMACATPPGTPDEGTRPP